MPSTTNEPPMTNEPPTITFLSEETVARNRLLDDIKIGASLKRSMSTEKSLVKTQGRVIDAPANGNGSGSSTYSPEPGFQGNGHRQNDYYDAQTPPTPPSTPLESVPNFYTVTVVPLNPQPIHDAPKPVVYSKFIAEEKEALKKEQQFQQQGYPPRLQLARTISSPAVMPTSPFSPTSSFSPTKTSQFGFNTLGRNQPTTATGQKLMISHGKPNFVINKKTPMSMGRMNSYGNGVKESIPKLKKVANSVLVDDEKKVLSAALVNVNFVDIDRQQRQLNQDMYQVTEKPNGTSLSPSSTTSSMSVASMDFPAPQLSPKPVIASTPTIANFSNQGPNFEQKTYISFAKDLAVTPNKYPDTVKVKQFVESIYADENDEDYQVDGYDLRLVKIDMEGINIGEMKVVKRD